MLMIEAGDMHHLVEDSAERRLFPGEPVAPGAELHIGAMRDLRTADAVGRAYSFLLGAGEQHAPVRLMQPVDLDEVQLGAECRIPLRYGLAHLGGFGRGERAAAIFAAARDRWPVV